jgi:tetratricopeptide (TPR) repeat protein/CHAT domain-containing protein
VLNQCIRCVVGLILLSLLVGGSVTVFAQSPELLKSYQQAVAFHKKGNYKEAVSFFQKTLKRGEMEFGPDHTISADIMNSLGEAYYAQSRHRKAETFFNKALAIRKKNLAPTHRDIAQSLNNLGLLYADLGRYGDAEEFYKNSMTIYEKALGPDHSRVGTSLNNLAELYRVQGRYAIAEPLYKKSQAIFKKTLGSESFALANSLSNLGLLYYKQGRYAEAEPLFKRSIVVKEKTLGLEHSLVGESLNNLALLYFGQDRLSAAEPLYKRALEIYERTLEPGHGSVAIALNNLAGVYYKQGRYADAEPLYLRSLAILEKSLGPDHTRVATSLNNLAMIYNKQRRFVDAERFYKRALIIGEKALGPQHPNLAKSLNNLARLYKSQGRFADAEPLYKRSLAMNERALGLRHPDVALNLRNLGGLYTTQGRDVEGLEYYRRATAIHQARAAHGGNQSLGGLSEQKSKRYLFTAHVRTAVSVARKSTSDRDRLVSESFSVGQLTRATQAGVAVSRMAARFAAGSDSLAKTVRELQDSIALWQKLDVRLIKLVSATPDKRNRSREKNVRNRLEGLEAKVATLSNKLTAEFPNYTELAASKPVHLGAVQKLLRPDEAMIAYLVTKWVTYVWVVRRESAVVFPARVGRDALQDAIDDLRGGLDASGIDKLADLPTFDRTAAHKLFKQIFAPIDKFLIGARHVFVVADGALQSLPLGVLVTDKPEKEFKDFSGYRQTAWLAKKYALTTLPSVSSLRALRTFAKRAVATIPFTGFGDPLLNGPQGGTRGIKLANLFRGSVANVDAIRDLPPLPDTAKELLALSAAVNGDSKHIYMRKRATERTVKKTNLSNSRIITFATHGLVAGDMKNAEPALVLTPPAKGTTLDDGLLTASEVAHLKLNADLVILSACNTAAGDGTEGAEGLSGLAKAFFYAGSRALLVSHWPVVSDAAVRLTTKMLTAGAGVGPAVALQRSMLALMNSADKPHYAHPLFWAPFVVVGEGGNPN